MSIHDEIGDMSGGQSHLWNGERRDAIVKANQFDPKRSNFQLKGDYSALPQEALAAAIACACSNVLKIISHPSKVFISIAILNDYFGSFMPPCEGVHLF